MAQLSQLLLFDPDPSGLDTLTYGFEREGCTVTGTSDVAKTSDLIQRAGPGALLVVNLRDPATAGLDLIRTTTSNPRTRNLACMGIGRGEHRAAALSAGAFMFLSTPLFVRDVMVVSRLAAAASRPGTRPSADSEVSLNLAEVDGIYFLVRAVAVTGRSTVVEVRHGPNRGELRFIDGTLTSAEVGSVHGLPALHRMLLWEDAALHFKFRGVVRRGAQLSMKSGEILEECDRFLRDFSYEVKDLGFARTRFGAVLDQVHPSAAFPSEVVPVLKLFDGQRDLAQALDESPFRIFDTLKIIKRFVADGAISDKTDKTATHTLIVETGANVTGPGALDSWLQRKAPVLGAEVGAGRSGLNGTLHTTAPVAIVAGASARSLSPFVVTQRTASEKAGAVGGDRKRTITKKNASEPIPTAMEDVITPPPVISPTDALTRPTAAVVRGEIRSSKAIPAQPATAPQAVQSVVIEPSALPIAVPLSSTAPPPVTAQPAPPSVIVAPVTVILDPAASIPTPLATPAVNLKHIDAKIPARAVTDSFSDVESDFFEREADLYKRESVETFDDLDGSHRNGGPRRR